MARKKKEEEVITTPIKMPLAKYKIGDSVTVSFLGQPRPAIIIALRQHPTQPKWIYKVKDRTGTIIPWVGINNQEQFANIIEAGDLTKEDLDSKKE
jgi:hypothetical protein